MSIKYGGKYDGWVGYQQQSMEETDFFKKTELPLAGRGSEVESINVAKIIRPGFRSFIQDLFDNN